MSTVISIFQLMILKKNATTQVFIRQDISFDLLDYYNNVLFVT